MQLSFFGVTIITNSMLAPLIGQEDLIVLSCRISLADVTVHQFLLLTNQPTNYVVQEPEGSSSHSQVRHRSLSWASRIQSNPPPQRISLRSILIPPSHLRFGLPSGLLNKTFLTVSACSLNLHENEGINSSIFNINYVNDGSTRPQPVKFTGILSCDAT
jgi:hypothetical protein